MHKIGNEHPGWKGYGQLSGKKFSKIKEAAKVRNLPFNITIIQLWDLFIIQNKKCALSGVDLDIKTTASLDRINSNLGYETNNIQWVHKDINYMKQEYDEKYFVETCIKIAQNPKPRIKFLNDVANMDFTGVEL